ncbi:MAG: dihydrodipicolinate synthase family protein, partial [Armatimonadetes bacterium]|nr:dihydrodipicolinate synthase family protein [Armatimonadota bacterium]
MTFDPLRGLVAATHTPFDATGELHLPGVERLAEHLLGCGVTQVFIGGSTGESASLSFLERQELGQRWLEIARGTALQVVVHVGGNCLREASTLAAQAQQLGARAVAMLAPSYFKPANVDALIACCAHVAAEAPELPFYFYDIPVLTGVSLPMADFLAHGREQIPNLAGLKWTNPDLFNFQRCLHAPG